jgi:hypothetical protein
LLTATLGRHRLLQEQSSAAPRSTITIMLITIITMIQVMIVAADSPRIILTPFVIIIIITFRSHA